MTVIWPPQYHLMTTWDCLYYAHSAPPLVYKNTHGTSTPRLSVLTCATFGNHWNNNLNTNFTFCVWLSENKDTWHGWNHWYLVALLWCVADAIHGTLAVTNAGLSVPPKTKVRLNMVIYSVPDKMSVTRVSHMPAWVPPHNSVVLFLLRVRCASLGLYECSEHLCDYAFLPKKCYMCKSVK